MTLRARIHVLVVLAVAPAFALLFFNHHQALQQREADAEQQALRNTWLVAAELEQVFDGMENLLRAAAETPVLAELQQPACGEYLGRLQQISAGIAWIAVLDPAGEALCGSNGAPAGELATRAIATGGMVIGTFVAAAPPHPAVLPVAVGFRAGNEARALILGIGLDWMREHFAGRFDRMPPDSSLTIADRKGIMLVRLPNTGREGRSLGPYGFVLNAATPGTFRSDAAQNADGIARFLGYLPLNWAPQGVAIAVGHPQAAVLAEARAGAVLSYVLLGSAAALAFLAAALGGRVFIRQPVAELLATIERWRNQDLSARISRTGGASEFAELGAAFNAMAERLQGALQHKDLLLRELGHRVMNSLQTISALFRLESRGAPPEAAAQFEHAVRRIDAIALAYRRMHAADGVESIEFAAFATELCRDLEASMMKASCAITAAPVHLPAKQAIPLSLILNELITNAVKHSTDAAAPIAVELRPEGETYRLAVRSPGRPPEAKREGQGGFGMKMVSMMVAQLNGKLDMSAEGGHIEFAVTFRPAALHPTV